MLIVAGSREIPGAALLAATAALRAGCGKLLVATAASVAPGIALQLPEARVLAMPELPSGGLARDGIEVLRPFADGVDAVLAGPGVLDEQGSAPLIADLIAHFDQCAVLLDAAAMAVMLQIGRLARPLLLTPHAGEMAHLVGCSKDDVLTDPLQTAMAAASRWNAVVALKGARTVIAEPGGLHWCHEAQVPGLATSGSGDVLAGIALGLAARGATLQQTAVWSIALHARAGHRLAERIGPLGFCARELADEIPALMATLQA